MMMIRSTALTDEQQQQAMATTTPSMQMGLHGNGIPSSFYPPVMHSIASWRLERWWWLAGLSVAPLLR
jgi:hypothetical protein